MYIVAVAGHEQGEEAPVSSSGVGAGDPVIPPTYPAAVGQFLSKRLPAAELEQVIWERDLCSLTKVSLRSLAALCKGKDEADALLKLASSQRKFSAHILSPAIDIVELLVALPSCRPALSDLMATLPALTPRLYSISSSPLQYDRTPAEEEGAAPSTSCPPASCTHTAAQWRHGLRHSGRGGARQRRRYRRGDKPEHPVPQLDSCAPRRALNAKGWHGRAP